MITLNIPENIYINEILKEKYPEFIAHQDKFYHLIHTLRMTWFNDNKYKTLPTLSKKARKKLFIPLNTRILIKLYGSGYYRKILDTLLAENIIETNNHYSVSEHAKGYRLAEKYQNAKTINYTVKENKLKQKIIAKQKEDLKTLSTTNKQILEMLKTKFTVDTTTAFNLINEMKKTHLIDTNTYARNYNQLTQLENRNFYFTESTTTGRIFHNYSNLKRELRNFISHVSEEKLVEVDITDCQPFMLGCILLEMKQTEDIKNFICILKNGKYKKYLRKEFNVPEHVSYDAFKHDLVVMLFCKSYWDTKHRDKFIELFPNVWEVMVQIKENEHEKLAHLLQSMEAELMIKTVAPILLENDVDFIPIHDSFIVQDRYAEQVTELIKSECNRLYGMIPLVKMK